MSAGRRRRRRRHEKGVTRESIALHLRFQCHTYTVERNKRITNDKITEDEDRVSLVFGDYYGGGHDVYVLPFMNSTLTAVVRRPQEVKFLFPLQDLTQNSN